MEVCCSGFERAGSSRELWRRKFGVGGGCPFFVGGGRAMGWRDLGGGCCGRGGVGWDDGWRLDGMGWDRELWVLVCENGGTSGEKSRMMGLLT